MTDKERQDMLELEKVFMEYEGDYVLQLINNPVFAQYSNYYFSLPNDELVRIYSRAYNTMEAGETVVNGVPTKLTDEEAEKVELIMIMSVLGMSDKIKELIKEKVPKVEEPKEEGMSHGRFG